MLLLGTNGHYGYRGIARYTYMQIAITGNNTLVLHTYSQLGPSDFGNACSKYGPRQETHEIENLHMLQIHNQVGYCLQYTCDLRHHKAPSGPKIKIFATRFAEHSAQWYENAQTVHFSYVCTNPFEIFHAFL